MTFPTLNLPVIAPQVVLVAAALLILLADLVIAGKRVLGWIGLIATLGALAAVFVCRSDSPAFQPAPASGFGPGNMALADGLGLFASAAVLIAAGLAILLAMERAADFTRRIGAYYALLLLATAGMTAMATASDLMTIFIALEIFSLALYILVGFNRKEARSAEAALKYFLLGAFASGFFLYGIALIYAATGTTNLEAITRGILPMSVSLPFAPLLPVGMGLLLVGFGFKVALVPFHMWTPDAYQGAPTPVTAFMSVATKAAAFAALIRVLAAVSAVERPWLLALAVLAVLTMTLGNLAALRQSSVKRMLAYSSIAHAGYLLTGLAAGNQAGAQGALYYLLAYTFMNLGAFAVLLAVQRPEENDVTNEQMTGLAGRQPLLAVLMAIFLFSLAGIPPLAGFFGKLYVFWAAVEGGLAWLAIVGVLNSALGAYYYLRVTVAMFMAEAPAPAAATRRPGWAVHAAIVLAALGTVVLGLWQWPWTQTIAQAVSTLALR
ncbi:MAG: NADH-quinone oxidoreductase subunit N [Anaerolineae bacterium]|nr:NADH-quinone oxidoreductase subunit N [Anaerolineae bacterium]